MQPLKNRNYYWIWILLSSLILFHNQAFAHGVDTDTAYFLTQNNGLAIGAFTYIGAKHMVTGYDHLLFLLGVIFFLYNRRDILLYVSLFTLGHSLTLLTGVLAQINVNAYLIDAIIGLSVVYKGFDNLSGFKTMFNWQPNPKYAVLIFGLFHGFGLATKIQGLNLPPENLWKNLVAFNFGVELGQGISLIFILLVLSFWRHHRSYNNLARITNTLLMSAGFILCGYQLTGYFLESTL